MNSEGLPFKEFENYVLWKNGALMSKKTRTILYETIEEVIIDFGNACINGNLEQVKYLVESGKADINIDNCAFSYAVLYEHLDIVKYLVEQGADVLAYDNKAIRYACNNGNLDIIKYLVEQDANIYDVTLKYATECGYLEIVNLLELKKLVKRWGERQKFNFIT